MESDKIICRKCNLSKSLDNFYFIKNKNRYFKRCKECYGKYRKEYVKNLKQDTKNEGYKLCKECKINLPIDNFNKSCNTLDGRVGICKPCDNIKRKSRYYKDHEETKRRKRVSWNKHREEKLRKHKEYRDKNREMYRRIEKKSKAKFYLKNKNDITFKLKRNLRQRARDVLKGKLKVGSFIKLLGCSFEEFKKHLESQFSEGMNWDNYGFGVGKWSLDHIIPLSFFDLENLEHLKKACHFSNLQPLWFVDNSRKCDKLPEGFLEEDIFNGKNQ